LTLTGVPDRPGIAARIFGALAAADVNVDMIVQNEPVSADRSAEISYTVPKSDLGTARRSLEGLTGELGLDDVIADEHMGKVSVVGAGMRSHPGVAAKVFQTLGENEINIEMISTSPIKISCVIAADRVADAVKALHDAFELGKEDVRREDGGPR
jgi:aspartate kinase